MVMVGFSSISLSVQSMGFSFLRARPAGVFLLLCLCYTGGRKDVVLCYMTS